MVALSAEEQRWCAALPAGLQPRYTSSRSQLRLQLASLLEWPALELPLHCPPAQPPRLAQGWGYVSLSHSREQLLLAWSPDPIGVDLEWLQRPVLAAALARRCFAPQEQERLLQLAPDARPQAVLESWVRKEAAIKCQGSTLARDLLHWSWDGQAEQLRHGPTGLCLPCCSWLRDGWLCAAAGTGVQRGIWG